MLFHKQRLIAPAALCAALFLPPSVEAAPPAGRVLASQCAQCHGTNGNGPGFDELAGKSSNELYNELREMKYSPLVEGIMDRQARGYTDAQLLLISDYLSTQAGGSSSSGGGDD